MSKRILFIHGGGDDGYDADAKLVVSLQTALGSDYDIHFPQIPDDGTIAGVGPQWLSQISKAVSAAESGLILVRHSLGASMLLKYVSENKIKKDVAGIFLIAPPFWSGDQDWVQPLKLREDFADKLPKDIPLFLYQCKDDEVVPFDHFRRYKQHLPWAVFREMANGGHQFNNDMSVVANDIRNL